MGRLLLMAAVLWGMAAQAHFLMVLPQSEFVTQEKADLEVTYQFMHPFEQSWMQMEKPQKAGVFLKGEHTEVTATLKGVKQGAFQTWQLHHTFKRPGDYILYVDPTPYFEPAEEKFIRHQTKTVISAFGQQEGWEMLVGLKAEMLPLTRPYGLWAGNLFSAQVLFNGKPVPHAEVEVEYFNEGSKRKAPHDSMVTQVVKADTNGVFHYAMPFAGWWGFAALLEDDAQLKNPKDGKMYPVELGAVMWVKCH